MPPAARTTVVRRVLANPNACRLFFLVVVLMEVADVVSDILWLQSVVSGDAFDRHSDNDDTYSPRYFETRQAIIWSTVGFFAVSSTLLASKLFDDLKHIFASDISAQHPYKRLDVFGLNVVYLLTMSNEEISTAYNQRCAASNAEKVNLWDSLLGLHRPDNNLDESYPLLAPVLVPRDASAPSPPTKLWEVLAYPIALTYSESFFHALPPVLSYILWPSAAATSLLSIISTAIIGLGNLFSKSKHSFTIRLFEDVPQLVINVVYLMLPFGPGRTNYVSLFSLALSGIMLLKFAVEVVYEACTTDVPCQLVRRRVAVPRRPSAAHTLRACFVSPFIGVLLAPIFFFWFLFEGLVAFGGRLCEGVCCGNISEWAPVEATQEPALSQASDDSMEGAHEEPLLTLTSC